MYLYITLLLLSTCIPVWLTVHVHTVNIYVGILSSCQKETATFPAFRVNGYIHIRGPAIVFTVLACSISVESHSLEIKQEVKLSRVHLKMLYVFCQLFNLFCSPTSLVQKHNK